MPLPIIWYARYLYKRNLYGQGIGRLTPEEMYHIFTGDLKAMSTYLGIRFCKMSDKMDGQPKHNDARKHFVHYIIMFTFLI